MAFDAGMLSACVYELKNKIIGAKIDKIYQPGREELVFNLRPEGRKENLKLLMSAGANTPRINLTNLSLQNPAVPPTFTQLLRKHLQSARITGVEQLGFERACRTAVDDFGGVGIVHTTVLENEVAACVEVGDGDGNGVGRQKHGVRNEKIGVLIHLHNGFALRFKK